MFESVWLNYFCNNYICFVFQRCFYLQRMVFTIAKIPELLFHQQNCETSLVEAFLQKVHPMFTIRSYFKLCNSELLILTTQVRFDEKKKVILNCFWHSNCFLSLSTHTHKISTNRNCVKVNFFFLDMLIVSNLYIYVQV